MIISIQKVYVRFHKIKRIKTDQKVFSFQRISNMQRSIISISLGLLEDNQRFPKHHKSIDQQKILMELNEKENLLR